MYDFIGDKIKGLAKAIFFVEAIAAIITGIALLLNEEPLIGILILVLGPIVAWVSSWLLYGFGQLIDNSDTLVTLIGKQLDQTENNSKSKTNSQNIAEEKVLQSIKNFRSASSNTSATIKRCPHCGERVNSKVCDVCGRENNLF